MIDVSIHILCERKPGILSRLIRDIKLFGLVYTGHNIEYTDDQCLISVDGHGELNCTREELQEMLNQFPGVLSVMDISIRHQGSEVSGHKTSITSERVNPEEALSPTILLMAEKRLAETLGPVANYLVETAAQNCNTCGELFNSLAGELNNDKERQAFLSIIA